MPAERLGCLGMILRFFGLGGGGSQPASPPPPKAMVNRYFFSEAEINCFRVLQTVVGSQGIILAQVSLKQLIWLPGNHQSNPGRSVWQNKIDKRSIDFVICDARTLRPRVALELDDRSHARPDRQQRDDEVDRVLAAAGLPLIHLPAARTYDTRQLSAAILPHLS